MISYKIKTKNKLLTNIKCYIGIPIRFLYRKIISLLICNKNYKLNSNSKFNYLKHLTKDVIFS